MITMERIADSDEVPMLYCCLLGRAIHESHVGTSFIRVKDRFKVVSPVKADRTKAPVTTTGKTNRPPSFPRRFDGLRDVALFWFA